MTKYSKLGNEIKIMQLTHKHEEQLLKMKHEMEINELMKKCTHTYDDGTSAREFTGTQWDSYHTCSICNKTIG